MTLTIEKLEEKIFQEDVKIDDFNSYYKNLKNEEKKFQELLEYAKNRKPEEREFEHLYLKVFSDNYSELIENLKTKGFALKKDLGKSFESMGFRLLEQTRAGKKDDVYYGLLRIFVSNNKKFPEEIIEVFKPRHSEGMFKILVFTFLSSIIGKEQSLEK